jgi:Cysteine rich repeat
MNLCRITRWSIGLLALGVSFTSVATAQSSGGQVSLEAMRAACSGDAARLCSGVQSGGGRVVACLKQHQDDLSDACRKAAGLPPRLTAAQPDVAQSSTAAPGSDSNAIADSAAAPASSNITAPTIGQPTRVAGEVFVRRPILDPAHGNMTVATMHVPEKWSFNSKVEWHYNWIENPLIVSMHGANPANAEAFYIYPLLRLESIDIAPQYRQYTINRPRPAVA